MNSHIIEFAEELTKICWKLYLFTLCCQRVSDAGPAAVGALLQDRRRLHPAAAHVRAQELLGPDLSQPRSRRQPSHLHRPRLLPDAPQ